MKFVVNSLLLLKKLHSISGVISSNNTLPILDDFLFSLQDSVLTVTASDIETTAFVSLNLEMADEPGDVTVPAKMLLDVLKNLPDSPVNFSVDPANLVIELTASDGKYRFTGHNANEYPQLPLIEDPATVELTGSLLSSAIGKTIFATGSDEMRPMMSGVFFELSPEYMNFVATDAHRLVRYRRLDAKAEQYAAFIMPRKSLNLLKNLLGDEDELVKVEYNFTNASFTLPDNARMVARLIDGKYPAYEAVIPKDNPYKLTVDRLALLNAVKRVSLFANQSTHQIRFKISGQELQLSAEDIDFSNEAVERLRCNYEGADLEIGFNSKFLLDMLNNMDTEEINLLLSAPNRAGILTPVNNENENEDILMLVMPVMLGNTY
jgi:DNA polymerase III subunit beta